MPLTAPEPSGAVVARPVRRRWWLPLLAIAAALALASYAAVLWVNHAYLTPWVSSVLPPNVHVQRCRLRWPATLVVDGLTWRVPDQSAQPWLAIPHATGALHLASLVTGRIVFQHVTLEHPRVQLLRDGDGRWNFPRADKPALPAAGVAEHRAPRWRAAVLSLRVSDGSVIFDDRRIAPDPVHIELRECALTVRQALSVLHGFRTQVELQSLAALRPQQPVGSVQLKGSLDWRRQDAQGVLTVRDLDVGALEPYLNRGKVTLRLYNTTAGTTALISVTRGQLVMDGPVEISNLSEGDVSIKGVTVVDVKSRNERGARDLLELRVRLEGPWRSPGEWQRTITPVGEQTVKLLRPLFEGRKETIVLKVGPAVAGQKAAAGLERTLRSVEKRLTAPVQQLLESEPQAGMVQEGARATPEPQETDAAATVGAPPTEPGAEPGTRAPSASVLSSAPVTSPEASATEASTQSPTTPSP